MIYDASAETVRRRLFKPVGMLLKPKVITRTVRGFSVVLGHWNGPLIDVPERGLEKIMSLISSAEIDDV
jgi:hypothetical protein